MSNIKLDVPAVEKLIDVVASGIGSVTGPLLLPYRAWMQAKANKIETKEKTESMTIEAQGKADATKLIAQAQAEVKSILISKQDLTSPVQIQTEVNMNTTDLVQTKIQFQEKKRLHNIQNIVTQAKDKLPEKTNNVPVDPDWIARFFQNAQDVSTKEMQQIWSSILAGEVETPGRTSLRTLDILKNMTKKEAELFNKVMKYKIDNFIFHDYLYNESIKKYFNYDDLLILEEINLLNTSIFTSRNVSLLKNKRTKIGEYWGYILQIYSQLNNSKKTIQIPGIALRKSALELSAFLHHTPDSGYLKLLAKHLKEKENCYLEIGGILKKEGAEVVLKPESLKVIQP